MPRPVRSSYSMPYGAAYGAPRAGGARRHQAADYHAPTWTPIYGVANGGRVAHIGANMDPNLGLGHNITIVYPGGVKTLDGHMVARTPLAYGQTVNENTIVGYVGATGNAVNGSPPGPHDHHMRWHNGFLVDPEAVYRTQPAGGGGGLSSVPIEKKEEPLMHLIYVRLIMANGQVDPDPKAVIGSITRMWTAAERSHFMNVYGQPGAEKREGVKISWLNTSSEFLSVLVAMHTNTDKIANAVDAALNDEQAALLAAIAGVDGGSIDHVALAASLATAIAPLLNEGASAEQIAQVTATKLAPLIELIPQATRAVIVRD